MPDPYYDDFVKTEGIPIHEMVAIHDVADVEVGPWERVGAKGCYIHLLGRGPANAIITELDPGQELNEQQHMYEESTFVVSGSGRTELWNNSGFQTAFNWERGAVFAIPLNTHYKHINRSSTEPLRLFSITHQPLIMNLYHDTDFIFHSTVDFPDRFNPTDTNFTKPAQSDGPGPAGSPRGLPFTGNLVPSGYDIPLPPAPDRGANGGLLGLRLANTALSSHISEFPSKSYKKAHRHGAGAHIILLNGTGYSLLWKADEEPIRVDWQPGAVIVPQEKWFHQHFNSGDTPARYLAFVSGGRITQDYIDNRPTRDGGDQIEYEDEHPRIREMFEQATAANS